MVVFSEKELLKKIHTKNLCILVVTFFFSSSVFDLWGLLFLFLLMMDYSHVHDSVRCTCIKDSIGVTHLLTGSLLMTGMWNVEEKSHWMSFQKITTPRNLYDLVFVLCYTFSDMRVSFVMFFLTLIWFRFCSLALPIHGQPVIKTWTIDQLSEKYGEVQFRISQRSPNKISNEVQGLHLVYETPEG